MADQQADGRDPPVPQNLNRNGRPGITGLTIGVGSRLDDGSSQRFQLSLCRLAPRRLGIAARAKKIVGAVNQLAHP
jgi:hypothetical protein